MVLECQKWAGLAASKHRARPFPFSIRQGPVSVSNPVQARHRSRDVNGIMSLFSGSGGEVEQCVRSAWAGEGQSWDLLASAAERHPLRPWLLNEQGRFMGKRCLHHPGPVLRRHSV